MKILSLHFPSPTERKAATMPLPTLPSNDEVTDLKFTPDLLPTLLASLRENRTVRIRHVQRLAASMLRGEWEGHGSDVITFIGTPGRRNFECKNGQHRILAYQMALETKPDLTIDVTVRFNAARKSTRVMDLNVPRDLADTLDFIEGRDPAHRKLATVTRLCWHLDRGSYLNRLPSPSRIQELDFADANRDDLLLAVEHGTQMQRRLRGPLSGYGGACWLILRGDHAELLDEFVEQVAKGEGLRTTDPAYQVREQLLAQDRRRGQSPPDHRRGWYYTGVLVKAWNDVVLKRDAADRPYILTRKAGIPDAL